MAVLSRFTGLTLATREELASQTAAFFARGLEGAANTKRLPLGPEPAAALAGRARAGRAVAFLRHAGGLFVRAGHPPRLGHTFAIEEFKQKIRLILPTPVGLRPTASGLRGHLPPLGAGGAQRGGHSVFPRGGGHFLQGAARPNSTARPSRRRCSSPPTPVPCGRGRTIWPCWAGRLFVRIRKCDQVTEDRLSDRHHTVKACLGDEYSAHSLRASFVTIAKLNGADGSQIMQQTKHRTRTMVDRYTSIQQVLRHNPAMKLAL